jgi:hypothetical protein
MYEWVLLSEVVAVAAETAAGAGALSLPHPERPLLLAVVGGGILAHF